MIIFIDYGAHIYSENYAPTPEYCPSCGAHDTWVDQGGGDYYAGVRYVCMPCGAMFWLPSLCRPDEQGNIEKQRIEKMRAAKSATATEDAT